MSDLKWYFTLVCAPAAAIAAAGLYFLSLQSARVEERALGESRARVEAMAAELQDAVREAPPDGREAALVAWSASGAAARPVSRFAWEPKSGARNIEGEAPEPVRAFSRWNEWTSPGRRNARRGLAAGSVLWARVGDAVYAVAFDASPVAPPAPPPLWPAGLAIMALLAGTVAAGGLLLWRAAARARRDDAEKTGFLSNVSHELKTPLAAIGLWAGMLKDGRIGDEERRRRAYDVIARENARMMRMVENLLDFARAGRLRRPLAAQLADVAAIAREAAEALGPEFPGALSLAAPAQALAAADPDAVRQILANLIGNAAKYAPRSPVEIAVESDGEMVSMKVSDRGPGMDGEAMKRCFERFYRAGGAKAGGLGLGLAISRSLAEEAGGTLSVSARAGGGLEFALRLPASGKAPDRRR